jgi:hypothetical protein
MEHYPTLYHNFSKTTSYEVLLYIQKKDGSQSYTYIQQLEEKSQTHLVVLQNTNSG